MKGRFHETGAAGAAATRYRALRRIEYRGWYFYDAASGLDIQLEFLTCLIHSDGKIFEVSPRWCEKYTFKNACARTCINDQIPTYSPISTIKAIWARGEIGYR